MRTHSLFLVLLLMLSACDSFRPKKTFRLAIPENDHSYNLTSQHLMSLLEQGGYNVKIIPAENAIEANHLVAQGKADLTFILNHSNFIPEKLGAEAGKLRTICPMYERLLFLFSREPVGDTLHAGELLEGRSIGIEVLDGETHANLNEILISGKIDDVRIISREQDSDLIHFWGTYYGPRATQLLESGWQEVSLSPSWNSWISMQKNSARVK